jgi:biotin carboxyl carrier protein
MLRKFNINVDGRNYVVAVEELSADGFSAPVPTLAPVAAIHTVAPAPVAAPPVAPTISAPVASTSSQDVLAPLAGVIDSIDVRVGQAVNAGDKVAVVEAMKMKTDVFAKVAGTVQRIAVKAHDSVDTDQVILTIG